MRNRNIIVSSTDRKQLLQLIKSARLDPHIPGQSLDILESELARATVVEPSKLPRDVIAMNSTVWFRDLDSQEVECYTLVFPSGADVIRDRISVLAPIGTALLGYRVGDIVTWRVPRGRCRLEIVQVAQLETAAEHESAAALV